MTELGRLQAILTADDRQFRSKMDAADSKAKATARSVQGTFSNLKLSIPSISGGSVGNLAGIANVAGGNLLTGALTKVAGVMSSGVTTGIAYNKMLETSAVAFETMGRSVTDTQQHLKDLETLGLKTPFELQDLIKASIQMEAFGFSAQDRIKDLRALSDGAAIAAAGTGDFTGALQGTITALGQMRAKGKLSAEEMNQLAERGIPVWDILSKKVGKTKEELMKLSERGQLKGDVAASLLTEGIGQFAGGAGDRLSRTAAGKESNLKDLGAKRAGEDTKQLFESYKASLDEAIGQLDTKVGQTTTNEIGKRLALDLDFVSQLFGGKISAKEIGAAIGPALRDSFVELKSIVVDGGAQLGAGLLQGFDSFLTGATGNAYQSVKTWAQGTIDAAKNVLGIKSPSRVFAEIGEQTIAGFDQGFENGKKKIRTTLGDLEVSPETLVNKLIDRTSEGMKKWGAAIKKAGGEEFLKAVEEIGRDLKIDPNKLMNVMAFESGLDPAKKNPKGSASGLIQITEATAEGLGTTTEKLRSMDAIGQLEYVKKYFQQFKSVADTQEAVYTAVLSGRPVTDPSQVLFKDKGVKSNKDPYYANRALDKDASGTVTAQEAAAMAYKQGFLKMAQPLRDVADMGAPLFDKIAQAAPKARETILHLGSLAGPIQAIADTSIRQRGSDGAQAMPFRGQIVEADSSLGGGTVRAAKDVLRLSDEVSALKTASGLSATDVANLKAKLDQTAASTKGAAAGMNAVTQASEDQIKALLGLKSFKELQKKADEEAMNNLSPEARFQRFEDVKARIGEGFDNMIDAAITGSEDWRQVGVSVIKDVFNSLASEMMLAATGGKYGSLGGLIGGSIGNIFKGIFDPSQKGAASTPSGLPGVGTDAGKLIIKNLAEGSEKVAKTVADSAAKTVDATVNAANQQAQQLGQIAMSNAEMANCACAPPAQPSLLGSVLGAVVGAVGAGVMGGLNKAKPNVESGGGYIKANPTILPVRRRAGGGSVTRSSVYMVGENEPELFVPNSNGRIFNQAQMRAKAQQQQAKQESGKGVTVVNNFTIQAPTGTVTPQTQQQIAAKTAQALNAALQRNG